METGKQDQDIRRYLEELSRGWALTAVVKVIHSDPAN
jgi:hypothetical protein